MRPHPRQPARPRRRRAAGKGPRSVGLKAPLRLGGVLGARGSVHVCRGTRSETRGGEKGGRRRRARDACGPKAAATDALGGRGVRPDGTRGAAKGPRGETGRRAAAGARALALSCEGVGAPPQGALGAPGESGRPKPHQAPPIRAGRGGRGAMVHRRGHINRMQGAREPPAAHITWGDWGTQGIARARAALKGETGGARGRRACSVARCAGMCVERGFFSGVRFLRTTSASARGGARAHARTFRTTSASAQGRGARARAHVRARAPPASE
ncbi:MAG: hypothetical protein J3K34DRAFT_255049 [Monoraphidium minutum]|nr:MAG: hypothetical protein J3K34DRAFT_255049 [Monoraphidium minutum]